MVASRGQILLSPPHMGDFERQLVDEVFESNWIAPAGTMITAFEQGLSELTGIGHVAALSSGSAALHLALRLSGIASGDEVWGSTMTFIGGVAPICYAGATPVFFDIDPNGLMMDLDLLEQALKQSELGNRRPKAIITTDLYGFMPDMDRLQFLKERFGFTWISDAAEAVGSYRDGIHSGKGADFAVFSFNGNKIITTSGGGALASDDGDRIERARFLSAQARDPAPHYEHTTFGYNYRLSNVCAAIGVGQLRVLEDRVNARRRIHDIYRKLLAPIEGISLSNEPMGLRSNRWLTTVIIDPVKAGFDREQARRALEQQNIESRPLWKPMHMQPVFQSCPTVGGDVARQAFDMGLCLPSGSAMSDADVERVCAVLLELT